MSRIIPPQGHQHSHPSSPPEPSASFDPYFASKNPDTVTRLSFFELIYSLSGLILGLVCVIGGIVLFVNGVFGSTSWTAKILGAESNISDAAPGVILFIVGLFIVLVTRFTLKIKK